ncbi:aldehyde dehydrogenase, partial [Heyndrickxia coagulans]|uniref:aldehyde dehydrogenase n=1 Tax=Heyndrickxia coagulans TaxID=1398 RepID=UPI002E243D88|nr:aldehyde dehydrogenase [Heyndrickxia coagulans]
MAYSYCVDCERVYNCEDEKCCCGSKKRSVDWEEFAFIMGYHVYTVKKEYGVFHLDVSKRLEAYGGSDSGGDNIDVFFYYFYGLKVK